MEVYVPTRNGKRVGHMQTCIGHGLQNNNVSLEELIHIANALNSIETKKSEW